MKNGRLHPYPPHLFSARARLLRSTPRVSLVLAENIKPDHAPDITQTIAEPYHKLQMTKAPFRK